MTLISPSLIEGEGDTGDGVTLTQYSSTYRPTSP